MTIRNTEHFFYACDGAALKSSKEMLEWMKTSSDESFSTHINSERNDFAGWIKTILKDNVLAKKIEKIKTREEVIEEIEKRLESKSKKSKKTLISQIKNAISHGSS